MKIIIYLLLIIYTITLSFQSFAQEKANEDLIFNFEKESSGSPFSQSKFVPDISLILDGSYNWNSLSDEKLTGLSHPGFTPAPSGGENAEEEINSMNGFSLNYAEITFFSIVDPYFDLFAVCHFSEEGADVEEGYFSTTSLPHGFQIKGGKFLSHFGRINEQHAHCWNFTEIPLAYQAFFGVEGLNEVGARVTWVAPTDFYLMLGSEILTGSNDLTFGNEGFESPDGSIDVNGSDGPNLNVSYIKLSFDVGNMIVLAGGSGAFGKTRINNGIDISGSAGNAIKGKSYVLGGDLTIKYQIDSTRNLSLQAEYLYRTMEGTYFEKDNTDTVTDYSVEKKQSGFYLQLIGKLSKRWRAGIRYDLFQLNDIKLAGNSENLPDNIPRYSAMIDYNPTEFSRIRLQYNYDNSQYESTGESYKRKINHQAILAINLAIGAHGAHSF